MTEATRRIIPFDATDCDPPELLTIAESAVRQSVSEQCIRNWIKEGLPWRYGQKKAGMTGRSNPKVIDAEDLSDFRKRHKA